MSSLRLAIKLSLEGSGADSSAPSNNQLVARPLAAIGRDAAEKKKTQRLAAEAAHAERTVSFPTGVVRRRTSSSTARRQGEIVAVKSGRMPVIAATGSTTAASNAAPVSRANGVVGGSLRLAIKQSLEESNDGQQSGDVLPISKRLGKKPESTPGIVEGKSGNVVGQLLLPSPVGKKATGGTTLKASYSMGVSAARIDDAAPSPAVPATIEKPTVGAPARDPTKPVASDFGITPKATTMAPGAQSTATAEAPMTTDEMATTPSPVALASAKPAFSTPAPTPKEKLVGAFLASRCGSVDLPAKNTASTEHGEPKAGAPQLSEGCASVSTAVVAGITPPPKPRKNVVKRPPGPMLYVGLTLEKPASVKSWGLMFTKGVHAHISRVTPPSSDGPIVKWCQITESTPHPSIVFRPRGVDTSTTTDEYETNLAKHFPPRPPECEEKRLRWAGLLVPYLNPGDAIICVNGIPVSAFPTTGLFADYIRRNCQSKMIIVALRHEYVWKATLAQMTKPVSQEQGGALAIQAMSDRVAQSVQRAWKKVLSGGGTTNSVKRKATPHASNDVAKRPKVQYTNNMFKDNEGKPVLYCDNDDCYDPEDGKRVRHFLNDDIELSFDQWLKKRKSSWRERRPRKNASDELKGEEKTVDIDDEECRVRHDFWAINGYTSLDHWLNSSKTRWKRSYSWHAERRINFQQECDKEVHFPMSTSSVGNLTLLSQFESWLGVRKNQWKLERRKRQRQRAEPPPDLRASDDDNAAVDDPSKAKGDANLHTIPATTSGAMYLDEILENQAARLVSSDSDATLGEMDISWVFDSQLGAPDDVIVNMMRYLLPCEHGNLLCLSYTTNAQFKQRDEVWKSLCPTHWTMPRRPRKSWAAMYIRKIRDEEEAFRKKSDGLLVKADVIIEKGDQLNKLQALVKKGVKDFDFDKDYTSGVVLERNSLLNLAVISGRHRISKWLIEEMGADIETCDRGEFTPLLNASWNGDKHLVRYLLARQANRTKIGYNHSSQGLAPPNFEGLTAEGWARKRGHDELAELISVGL